MNRNMRNPLSRSKRTGAPAKETVADETSNGSSKPSIWRGHKDRSMDKFPGILPWLKIIWPDIIVMLCIAAVALGFNVLKPPYERLFAITFQDGQVASPELAYPYRKPVLNSAVAGVLVAVVPITCFVLMQMRLKRWWDLNNSILGLGYALLSGSCFQVMIKSLIGGFRPHFLSVCIPDMNRVRQALESQMAGPNNAGFGFQTIYFNRHICTGLEKDINNGLISFPSGHTEAAFAGLGFLFLYFNAKFKVFSNYQPRYWKIIITFIPILGAVLIACNLQMTYNHFWYDILAGAAIGIVFALASYRAMYASIWDFRFNHVPLMRHAPFHFSNHDPRYSPYYDCCWTREAEWGLPVEELGGAPGDAAYNIDIGRLKGDGHATAPAVRHSDTVHNNGSTARRDAGDVV